MERITIRCEEIRITGQPRPRHVGFKNGFGHTYSDSPKSKALKEHIRESYKLHKLKKYSGPIKLELCFILKRNVKATELYHQKRPDIDNLSKLVMDALNGVAYDDDKLVVELCAYKLVSDHVELIELTIQTVRRGCKWWILRQLKYFNI